MEKTEAQKFIQQSIERGETIESIYQQLINAGWDEVVAKKQIQQWAKSNQNLVEEKTKRARTALGIMVALVVVLGTSTAYLWYDRMDLSQTNAQKVRNFYARLSDAQVGFTESGTMIFPDEQKFISAKEELVQKKKDFIEVDLRQMRLVMYEEGVAVDQMEVLTKGKEGSWWETPTGNYEVLSMFTNKFSSIGNVWMPYSIQIYGNYFIHGWPHYSDGRPVPEGYSGGCIRLSNEDAREVFGFVRNGMSVLVLEEEVVESAGELVSRAQSATLPAVSAQTIRAEAITSEEVLLEKNAEEQFVSRSATAMMTAVVAHEVVYLARPIVSGPPRVDDELFVPEEGKSYVGMDLLYPLLMQTSLNAGDNIASSVGKTLFVQNMNNKASSLGMDRTTFSIQEDGEIVGVTTADDTDRLLRYVYYKRPFLLDISKGNIVDNVGFISVGDSIRLQDLENTNKLYDEDRLVGQIQGIDPNGTESSISVVEFYDGTSTTPVSITVSGSADSAKDTKVIMDWIRQNYE